MSSSKNAVIIIKKIKKGGHGGHHGGAWKVAYADFVTAMMAFFLLMWLLNATTEEQRRGISNYFGPVGNVIGAGGTGGILGGNSLEKEGNFRETRASSPLDTHNIRKEGRSESENDDGQEAPSVNEKSEQVQDPETQKKLADAQKMVAKYEKERLKEAADRLKQAIQNMPEMKQLAQNLIIDQTPEGLRIQLVDQRKISMFPSGSAEMYPHTHKLLEYVVKVVEKMPNKISITGHTDSKKYSPGAKYTNWELSSDRANATRRALLDLGLESERLLYVAGRADTEPLNKLAPESDQNRRISIVIHRSAP